MLREARETDNKATRSVCVYGQQGIEQIGGKGRDFCSRCGHDPADTARLRQRQERLSCSTWRTERINLILLVSFSRRGVDGGHSSTEDGGSREEDAVGHEDRRAQAGGEGDHHGQEAQDLRRRQAEEEQVAKGVCDPSNLQSEGGDIQ